MHLSLARDSLTWISVPECPSTAAHSGLYSSHPSPIPGLLKPYSSFPMRMEPWRHPTGLMVWLFWMMMSLVSINTIAQSRKTVRDLSIHQVEGSMRSRGTQWGVTTSSGDFWGLHRAELSPRVTYLSLKCGLVAAVGLFARELGIPTSESVWIADACPTVKEHKHRTEKSLCSLQLSWNKVKEVETAAAGILSHIVKATLWLDHLDQRPTLGLWPFTAQQLTQPLPSSLPSFQEL